MTARRPPAYLSRTVPYFFLNMVIEWETTYANCFVLMGDRFTRSWSSSFETSCVTRIRENQALGNVSNSPSTIQFCPLGTSTGEDGACAFRSPESDETYCSGRKLNYSSLPRVFPRVLKPLLIAVARPFMPAQHAKAIRATIRAYST